MVCEDRERVLEEQWTQQSWMGARENEGLPVCIALMRVQVVLWLCTKRRLPGLPTYCVEHLPFHQRHVQPAKGKSGVLFVRECG